MIRLEDINCIISRHYKMHSSVFLTREVKSKDGYFFNFSCPKQTRTLIDAMNVMSQTGEVQMNSIEAKLYNKPLSPYKCDEYVIKVSEKKGPNSSYISVSFYGVTGFVVKKAYGRYEVKLTYNPRHLISIYINANNGDLYGNGVVHNESVYPMSFSPYVNKLLMHSDAFRSIFKDILMLCANGRHIIKDIVRTIDEDGYVAMPITVFDIKKYRTKDEMIRGFTGSDLPVDFNRRSLNHGYLLAELAKHISQEQQGYMIQMDRKMIIDTVRDIYREMYPLQNFELEFIARYYMKKLSLPDTRTNRLLVHDYIRLAKDHGLPVSLTFKTVNRLVREHNLLARQYRAEELSAETAQPLIAENTRFAELRRILPPEFEWITDTGRLFNEGEAQRNCVFSYRDIIRNDQSAIYHWSKDGREYTLEFGCTFGGKFRIKQMLQTDNRPARAEDIEYIEACLGNHLGKHSEEHTGDDWYHLDIPEGIDDAELPFF